MSTIILDGKVITPDQVREDCALFIEEGRITGLLSKDDVNLSLADRVIDAGDFWVAPGLIDIHVHGGMGCDTMDATPEALTTMGRFFVQHGVTSYLATTTSNPRVAIDDAIQNFLGFSWLGDGARPLGLHIEGPYLNPHHRGAQPPEMLRKPEPQEYRAWFETGAVRLMTVAPELKGATELIEEGLNQGVEFAIGHSGASYEQAIVAADKGLRQASHTFNGMLGLHHRSPGTVGGVMTDDRIYAQIIADGVHLHPAVVDLILRAKGRDRCILITDAMRATGFADGEYDLGGQTVFVMDGEARIASGSLAGSTLTLDAAIRNVLDFADISFPEAVHIATYTPADALGLLSHKGVLQVGADADVTLFDNSFCVRLTMVGGHVVYEDL